MDDWEADLDDLLASDDDFKKPKKKAVAGASSKSSAPVVKDDDFYASLAAKAAATAEDNEFSDVSDADPLEIAKQIEGLDDMDAALFSGMKSPRGSSTTTKNPANSQPSKPSTKALSNNDIADYDDPLADLLGDDAPTKKPKSVLKKRTDTERPRTGERKIEDDDSASVSSRRHEVERPPTRSGQKSDSTVKEEVSSERPRSGGGGVRKNKATDDIMFDDDDVLGGMGLDSPRDTTQSRAKSGGDDSPKKGGAKSILDDLLGSPEKSAQRPSSGGSKEFVLDKKYTKSSGGTKAAVKKEPEEDEYQFGSYMPSSVTAGNTGSRPSSRRSVRFEDEDDPLADMFSTKSSAAGKARGASGYLEDSINKDSRDWLDIATNTTEALKKPARAQEDDRPRSAGNVLDVPHAPDQEAGPGDWFGISRIGSPDGRPGASTETASTKQTDKPKAAQDEPDAKPVKEIQDDENDDWLAKIKEKKASQSQATKPAEKAASSSDDWLGLGSENKADDWLGTSQNKSKGDDWLGLNEAESEGGAIGASGSGLMEDGDDYLGLGGDVDLDSVMSKPAPKAGRRSEDLFSSPPKRNLSESLPWEKPQRMDQVNAAKSPAGKSTNLADSPRGLMATLDTLVQMEQNKEAVPMPSAAVSAVQLPPAVSATAPVVQMQSMVNPAESAQIHQQQQTQLQHEMRRKAEELQRQQHLQLQNLQQQQEQQLQALKLQQQQSLQQTILTQPLLAGSSMGQSQEDLLSQIRKLELEKSHVMMMMETVKLQQLEEKRMLEDSFRRRMELLEETQGQRETRLKEEVSMLSTQMMNRIQQVELDKTSLVSSHQQRLSQLQDDKDHELSRLKDLHRSELALLKEDHQMALERLRKAKDLEIETVSNAHDTSRSLSSVISQVQNSAADLGQLSSKVENQHLASMEERESAAKARDEQLKVLQERLGRQQHENELERARLQGLVTKLEIQLTEQTRHLEEEKWRVRQEETKWKGMQDAVEQEKKALLDQVQKERAEMDKAKDQLLIEQQTIMTQLNEERRLLAEERAQFTVSQRIKQDQDQRENVTKFKAETEMNSTVKAINDEKERLGSQSRELILEKKRLLADREKLNDEMQMIQIEKEKLEQIALQVRQRSKDIEDMCSSAARARDEGSESLHLAKQAEAEQTHRLNKIQNDLQILRNKERQIAEERLGLAREKQELERTRGSMLCVSCRTPIKDTPEPAPQVAKMTPAAQNLFSALGNFSTGQAVNTPHAGQNSSLQNIASAIEMDRSVCTWRIAANRDKEYLAEETMFLEAIKHAPYHPTNTASS